MINIFVTNDVKNLNCNQDYKKEDSSPWHELISRHSEGKETLLYNVLFDVLHNVEELNKYFLID